MPSDADFIRLEKIALLAVNDDRASAYTPWLAAKGGGLKAQAKAELDVFLKTASTWSEKQKQVFVTWLDEIGDDLDDRRVLTPHPMMARLVLPTLKNWIVADPKAAEPHLLQGRFHDWRHDFERPENHFRMALQLDPSLLAARRGLLLSLLGAAQNNQHHLPKYCHGDRKADAESMVEAIKLSAGMLDPSEAEWFRERAELLRKYATGEAEGAGGDNYHFPRRGSWRHK